MKLNHLNLTVSDVAATEQFLSHYFGLRSMGVPNANIALLLDDDGAVITLLKGANVSYPATFHIGFKQESEDRVNEINLRLKSDGYQVEPPRRFHGSWTFYLNAPSGFQVEVLY